MLIRFFSFLLLLVIQGGAFAADTPLEPEQAFLLTSVRVVEPGLVEARWQIADDYYLYRERFKFAAEPATVKLGAAQTPPGDLHDDPNLGRVETYRHEVKVLIPFEVPPGTLSWTLKTKVQGCADLGICYPPLSQQAIVDLTASPAMGPAVGKLKPFDNGNDTSRASRLLRSGSLWLVLTSFFGFGLLLSFTPCVLPMVPIISGIIVNHGHAVTHARAFALTLAYVLGMAATYAAAGVAAGYSGTLLSAALQNAWVLGSFALIFVVLSLSMFGFYELQLPSALQSRLSETANHRKGSMMALATMGALSALIIGPCVAAPLAGALLYIAQTGNAVLGGSALFAMALGMGAPLLVVGMFSRSLLPKTGPWMDAVKKFFGVLLLATALWLVSPVISAWAQLLGWATLLIVPAIFMHALDSLPTHAGGWQKFWKGIGVAMLLAGAAMLAGALGGSRDPLRPLAFLGQTAMAETSAHFERVASRADLDMRLKNSGKPVMLDFYADWCASCKEMERNTFEDAEVKKVLAGFTLLQVDVTANTEEDIALLKRFGLVGPPGILFFNGQGIENQELRVIGYQPPEQFILALKRATAS
ncbi:MAG: protein-disulfide reductase DsbD [Georgfuchsia sp.]